MKSRKTDSTHACYYCFTFYNLEQYNNLARTSDKYEICDRCQIDSIIQIPPNLSTSEIEQQLISINQKKFNHLAIELTDLEVDFFEGSDEDYNEYEDEYYTTTLEKFNRKKPTYK